MAEELSAAGFVRKQGKERPGQPDVKDLKEVGCGNTIFLARW